MNPLGLGIGRAEGFRLHAGVDHAGVGANAAPPGAPGGGGSPAAAADVSLSPELIAPRAAADECCGECGDVGADGGGPADATQAELVAMLEDMLDIVEQMEVRLREIAANLGAPAISDATLGAESVSLEAVPASGGDAGTAPDTDALTGTVMLGVDPVSPVTEESLVLGG